MNSPQIGAGRGAGGQLLANLWALFPFGTQFGSQLNVCKRREQEKTIRIRIRIFHFIYFLC